MQSDSSDHHEAFGPDRSASLPLESGARLRRRVSELEDQGHVLEGELASVMAAIDAGIVTLDADGAVRSQNDSAARILGRRIDTLAAVFGPLGADRPAIETTRQPFPAELQLVDRPDRWLEVTRHAWSSGQTAEVVVIRDVTEARQSHGLRDAFLGMLSHELRTPVTSIYGASQLLRAGGARLDAEERAGLVADIGDESERLLRLVEDLLVLAHFDEGIGLVQEPSLLQHVIPVVVERERLRRPDIDIRLEIVPDLPVVVGDETSVQQVVRNLVSNACKYGDGKPVDVALTTGDEPGAIVRVLDRGPGVTPEESEALFQPFFRSTKTARASSGAGIGLYVCRRLVEAMGGHMWARRRGGGGSEFGFWLPEYAHQWDDGSETEAEPILDAAPVRRVPQGATGQIGSPGEPEFLESTPSPTYDPRR